MSFKHILLLLTAAMLSACTPSEGQEKGGKGHGGPGGGMPPAEVNAMTVELRPVPVSFEYVGQTAGSREVEVRARVTGILLARNFKEGGRVEKGQSLFTIDPAPFQAALLRAEADVAAAEARLDQASRNAARFKPLYAEKAVSQKEYDDAVSAEAINGADLKAARARLTEARLSLSYTKVESPVAGIAGKAQRSDGSLVSGPDVLLTSVTQIDPIWVNFGIPDNDAARLQREVEAGRIALPKGGFEVQLRLSDGSMFSKSGRLNFSDVRVNPSTGTREARAELPNPNGGALRPGQFVRVILKGGVIPNAVTVPQRAVLESPQGGKFVYVVDEKSSAAQRPVEAGEWSGESWIITSGLKAGEKVITDGLMKLGPGAPVRIAEKKEPEQQKPEQQKPAAKK